MNDVSIFKKGIGETGMKEHFFLGLFQFNKDPIECKIFKVHQAFDRLWYLTKLREFLCI